MVKPTRPPANGFVAAARKVYNPIGFAKGYNFVLFVIFNGSLLGFSLSRMMYLNYYGIFCHDRGECYRFLSGTNSIGFMLHLFCIIPAGFLVCLQFVPAIRHKLILLHRINGYIVIILSVLGTAGAFMIARDSLSGRMEVQTGIGLASIMFLGALAMGYYNIKRLQIEQHRAWMLRAWVYASSIITLRILLVIYLFINTGRGYFQSRECGQIDFEMKGNRTRTLTMYPECKYFYSGENPHQNVVVEANLTKGSSGFGSLFELVFGSTLWLAFLLHVIGVEIYLQLTPAEAERLRNVSYQRQLEAGFKNPGRAGLTVDRFGDAEKWIPASQKSNSSDGVSSVSGEPDKAGAEAARPETTQVSTGSANVA